MACVNRIEALLRGRASRRSFVNLRAEFYLANAVTIVYTMKSKAQVLQNQAVAV